MVFVSFQSKSFVNICLSENNETKTVNTIDSLCNKAGQEKPSLLNLFVLITNVFMLKAIFLYTNMSTQLHFYSISVNFTATHSHFTVSLSFTAHIVIVVTTCERIKSWMHCMVGHSKLAP